MLNRAPPPGRQTLPKPPRHQPIPPPPKQQPPKPVSTHPSHHLPGGSITSGTYSGLSARKENISSGNRPIMTSRPVSGTIPVGLPPPSLLLGSMPIMGINQPRNANMIRVATAPSAIQVTPAHTALRVAAAAPSIHPQRATLQAAPSLPQ